MGAARRQRAHDCRVWVQHGCHRHNYCMRSRLLRRVARCTIVISAAGTDASRTTVIFEPEGGRHVERLDWRRDRSICWHGHRVWRSELAPTCGRDRGQCGQPDGHGNCCHHQSARVCNFPGYSKYVFLSRKELGGLTTTYTSRCASDIVLIRVLYRLTNNTSTYMVISNSNVLL